MANTSFCVLVDLYKNPSFPLSPNGSANFYPFCCFGYYDGAILTILRDIKTLYSNNLKEAGNIESISYEKQSLHLYGYSDDDKTKLEEIINPEIYEHGDNLLMISEIQISQQFISKDYQEHWHFELNRIVKQYLDSNFNYASDQPQYCLLNSLDHADFVLLMRSDSFTTLYSVILYLRSFGSDGVPFVLTSYSTTLFPSKDFVTFGSDESKIYDVSIRATSNGILSDFEFKNELDKFAKRFCPERHKTQFVFGKYDFDLLIESVSPAKIIDIRRNLPSFFERHILSSNIRWLFPDIEPNQSSHQVNLPGNQEIKLAKHPLIDERMSDFKKVLTTDNEKKEFASLVRKYLWTQQVGSIDVSITRKITEIVAMLNEAEWNESCAKATVIVSEFIDQQNQASRSVLERPSENTLFGGSIAKIERFFSTIITAFEACFFSNSNGDKWLQFLLINHKPDAHSYHYFLSPKQDLNSESIFNLIVMTMGTGLITDLFKSIPVLLHEIGHYLPLTEKEIEKHNDLFIFLISSVISKQIIFNYFTAKSPQLILENSYKELLDQLHIQIRNKIFAFCKIQLNSFGSEVKKLIDRRIDDYSSKAITELCLSVLMGKLDADLENTLGLDENEDKSPIDGSSVTGWFEVLQHKKSLLSNFSNPQEGDDLILFDEMKCLLESYQSNSITQDTFKTQVKDLFSTRKSQVASKTFNEDLTNFIELIERERQETDAVWKKIYCSIVDFSDEFLERLNSISVSPEPTDYPESYLVGALLPLVKFSANNYSSGCTNSEWPFFTFFSDENKQLIFDQVQEWTQIIKEVIADNFMNNVLDMNADEYRNLFNILEHSDEVDITAKTRISIISLLDERRSKTDDDFPITEYPDVAVELCNFLEKNFNPYLFSVTENLYLQILNELKAWRKALRQQGKDPTDIDFQNLHLIEKVVEIGNRYFYDPKSLQAETPTY